ncbi:DUF4190 domain-containing protein [Streptomyces sp. DT24]|uniref:DUF4190 domain-containing protein n=1 Tax=unclassified Streptomyces TaxID=2593676 RepID=UPI0023BA3DA0|nr:DUF4190 domain-containing protein [Streptomyces sp. AM 4-1-1]WEH33862.1 DUF4190 domain-containing protein [Streptomyces sp. AM 4-1-1]
MSQYTQPPQPQSPYGPAHAPGQRPARNGLGITALLLGIFGAVSGVIPFLFWLAGILGLIALVLGLSGLGRAKRGEATNKGVATFGVVLGVLSLILSVVGAVITFKAVGDAVDEIDKATTRTTASASPAAGDKGDAAKADDESDKGAEIKALGGGDTAIYDDDLKVTVSEPSAYSPSEYAAGHTEGNKAYKVDVVIENAGKKKFDATLATVDARAGQDGVTAEQIFDDTVGEGFSGSVLPGKKVTVRYAFDTPSAAKNLTVEVSPGFDYEAHQWELKL